MKGPAGKPFEGIYCNPRFVHTAASLVGCVVQVQVKNGAMYEGVLRTCSHKVDLVLEMVHKVDFNKSNSMCSMLTAKVNPEEVSSKVIFRIEDVVMLSSANVDLDFASRDSFTDTAISKFNGQVLERVLEPWDGDLSNTDSLTELGTEAEVSNGWDADDMFRTNEVKYGVKSSFDSDLHDYTIPLKKQNTEEYKLQEAKACKIAHEIESGLHYKNRIALENGDEEERYSAVVRSDAGAANSNNSNNNRFITQRPRKPQGVRPVRNTPSPNAYQNNRVPNSHPQHYHKVSSPNPQIINTQGKMVNSKPASGGIQSPSPRSPLLPPKQAYAPSNQVSAPQLNGPQPQPLPCRNVNQSTNVARSSPTSQSEDDIKINGEVPQTMKEPCAEETSNKEISKSPTEVPEKRIMKKARDDKTEDLKRFHEKFKLPEAKEVKETSKKEVPESEENSEPTQVNDSKPKETKETAEKTEEEVSVSEVMKNTSLNPNAKEFILNPNAKSFTPRGLPTQTTVLPPPPPPPSSIQPPQRLHTQSPVIALPQPHLVPTGMTHPMFSVGPHYVVPATPVSVPLAPSYTPASSMAQAPRYRKEQAYGLAMGVNECEDVIFSAIPMTYPRNDSSQSIHVQAATGQPILAPHALSTPQFTIQYAASSGILHPPVPPQPQLTYTQMYSMLGQRVITPQPLGMVSNASYGDNPHVPTQIYMNPQAVAHPGPSGSSGQHSTPSTPQSQTPSLHPAPSPVHQPPPSVPHGQAQTPTGHPSNPPTPHVIYHGQITAQHPLHINPGATSHSHPYPAVYGAGPHPLMIMPPQAVPGPHPHHPGSFPSIQNHLHAQQPGAHGGTPAQIIPHPPVAVMPTSTAMAHGQASISTSHYASHSQERSPQAASTFYIMQFHGSDSS